MGQRRWERAGLVVTVKAFHEELEATSFLVDLRGSQLSCPAANVDVSRTKFPMDRSKKSKNWYSGGILYWSKTSVHEVVITFAIS